jgi:hypothetical protein
MDFEEFFRKKRIDMAALQTVQPSLFSEFKTHFVEMGEKSFDHTKKYWFNKLRHEFPLAVEPKLEKVKIDNPLAEQTITESLIEQSIPTPKLGFTPKFRAAAVPPKPVETEESKTEKPAIPAPKLGFTPKFKASAPAKTVEEIVPEDKPAETPAPAPKLGFTPKFKAAAPPKVVEEIVPEDKPAETPAPAPKLGFTPKFKAANLPKPVTEIPAEQSAPIENAEASSAEDITPKPAYKPRFKMQNIPKKEE